MQICRGHMVLYSTLLIGHTQHMGHKSISFFPSVPKKLQGSNHQTQDMVFIHPPWISEGAFSSGWITSGSANFCCCSISIQRQMLACSTADEPIFLCCQSSLAHGNKAFLHIHYILHILHILNDFQPQPGSTSVSPRSYTSAVNELKSCM